MNGPFDGLQQANEAWNAALQERMNGEPAAKSETDWRLVVYLVMAAGFAVMSLVAMTRDPSQVAVILSDGPAAAGGFLVGLFIPSLVMLGIAWRRWRRAGRAASE